MAFMAGGYNSGTFNSSAFNSGAFSSGNFNLDSMQSGAHMSGAFMSGGQAFQSGAFMSAGLQSGAFQSSGGAFYAGTLAMSTNGRIKDAILRWAKPPQLNVPAERWGHAAVSLSKTQMLVVGGVADAVTNDSFVFDTQQRTWSQLNVANEGPKTWKHTAVRINNKVYVYGGRSGSKFLDDISTIDLDSLQWIKIKPKGKLPPGRSHHAVVVVSKDSPKMLVFGGQLSKGKFDNSLWLFDPKKETWSSVAYCGSAPRPRAGHTFTATTAGEDVILFGGHADQHCSQDLFVLNLKKMMWLKPVVGGAPPAPTSGHVAVAIGNSMVVFGGYCHTRVGTQFWNTLHILSIETWVWTRPQMTGISPQSCSEHSAAMLGDILLVFGGSSESGEAMADLLALDLSRVVEAEEKGKEESKAGEKTEGDGAKSDSQRASESTQGQQITADVAGRMKQLEQKVLQEQQKRGLMERHLRHERVLRKEEASQLLELETRLKHLCGVSLAELSDDQVQDLEQTIVGHLQIVRDHIKHRQNKVGFQLNELEKGNISLSEYSGWLLQYLSKLEKEPGKEYLGGLLDLVKSGGIAPVLDSLVCSMESQMHKQALEIFLALVPALIKVQDDIQEASEEEKATDRVLMDIGVSLKFFATINMGSNQVESNACLKQLADADLVDSLTPPFFTNVHSPAVKIVCDWMDSVLVDFNDYCNRHGIAFPSKGATTKPLCSESEVWEMLGRAVGGSRLGGAGNNSTWASTQSNYNTRPAGRAITSSQQYGTQYLTAGLGQQADPYAHLRLPAASAEPKPSTQVSSHINPTQSGGSTNADGSSNMNQPSAARQLVDAIDEVQQQFDGWPQKLTVESILRIHKAMALSANVPGGEYRSEVVTGTGSLTGTHRCFIPYEEVPKLMELMIKRLGADEVNQRGQVLRAYLFYSTFVYFVHPFKDGNGRTGRVIANCMLKAGGYDAAITHQDKVLSFDAFFWRVKPQGKNPLSDPV